MNNVQQLVDKARLPTNRIQLMSASVTRAVGHPARRPAEDGRRGRG